MSKAEDAYNEAQHRIAEAKAKGEATLSLKIGGLEIIPPEISELTNLTDLFLKNTRIFDAAPLADLTNLTILDLHNTQVSDATPLGSLSNLTTLFLSHTQISDAAPLAGLSSLSTLEFGSTQISNATPLASLTRLTLLNLNNTQISDAAPLAGLTSLTGLDLSNTQISDATPLASLTSLTDLDFRNTLISDAAPLASLASLTHLYLDNTKISDAAPLAGLTNLTLLNLSNTQISDAAPLAGLTGLTTLDLRNTMISDLRTVKDFDGLVGDGFFGGLRFEGCAATRLDPELDRLSKIEDAQERTRNTLAYLKSLKDWPPNRADKDAQDDLPITKFTAPTAFTSFGPLVEIRHAPKRSEARQASATPIDQARCQKIRAGLEDLSRTLCRALRKYKREDEATSNRVRAAEQLLITAEALSKTLAEPAEDFLPTLMQDYVETLALGFNEDVLAFEANDVGLFRRVIARGREHYACYPELAEIADPTNTRFIPDNFPYSFVQLSAEVDEIAFSVDGRSVFTDKTRELIEAEKAAKVPAGVDEEKTKLARLSGIVAEMRREMVKHADRLKDKVNEASSWLKTYEKVEKIWQAVKEFIGNSPEL